MHLKCKNVEVAKGYRNLNLKLFTATKTNEIWSKTDGISGNEVINTNQSLATQVHKKIWQHQLQGKVLCLTRVKVNVSVLGAVAALGGGHQHCRVRAAAVKLHGAGSVVGGAGSHAAVLPGYFNDVETRSAAFRPGEIAVVCPTVHTNG